MPDTIPRDPSHPPARIVVIDDDEEMRGLLASTLSEAGYDLTACRNGLELLDLLESTEGPSIDLVISDVRMPGVSGLSLLEGIRAWDPFPRMILITAFGSAELHARARSLGASAVLDKPVEMEDLLAAVSAALPALPSAPIEPAGG